MTSERFVFDTNVLVSALLFPRSVPRRVFDVARNAGTLLASEATLSELVRTLRKPKLARYLTPTERDAFLHAYTDIVESIIPTERISVSRDPQDNAFLEAAIAGRAGWLITGDDDLLVLGTFRGVRIVKPADCLNAIQTAL